MKKADQVLERLAIRYNIGVDVLRERSTDQAVIEARLLAVPLLLEAYDNDTDRVLTMLNCTTAHVALANKLRYRTDEDGAAFRKKLDELRGIEPPANDESKPEPTESDSKTREVDEKLSPPELLLRIVEERLGIDRSVIVSSRSHGPGSVARHVLAYVGKRVFNMSTREIGEMCECRRDTAGRIFSEACRDYGPDPQFTREVDAICSRLSVSLKPRKSMMT